MLRNFGIIAIFLVLGVAAFFLSADDTSAQGGTIFRPDPLVVSIIEGQTKTVNIVVENIQNLYGGQLYLSFDPTVVEVVDADPGTPGIQVTPGTFPKPDFVLQKQADNIAGTIDYVTTSLTPTLPSNGSGTFVSIQFRCKVNNRQSPITLRPTPATILAVIVGPQQTAPAPYTWQNGTINCVSATTTVDGYIGLQGRVKGAAAPMGGNGAKVTMACAGGACVGSDPITITTDVNGYYQRPPGGVGTGVVTGTYTVTVTRRGYLPATKVATVTIVAGSNTISPLTNPQVPTLLGGDLNGDGKVNILDLSAIGGAYGMAVTPDTGADINGDGHVNIFDMTLAGGNYGLSLSSWP